MADGSTIIYGKLKQRSANREQQDRKGMMGYHSTVLSD